VKGSDMNPNDYRELEEQIKLVGTASSKLQLQAVLHELESTQRENDYLRTLLEEEYNELL
jgi:hypothetical protein